MSDPTHDPELTAVERAPAGLAPSPGALDRDAPMFAAGRRSVRRGWAWPGAAAAFALTAAALAALLVLRPSPEPAERVVYVEVPTPPRPAPPDAADDTAAPGEATP